MKFSPTATLALALAAGIAGAAAAQTTAPGAASNTPQTMATETPAGAAQAPTTQAPAPQAGANYGQAQPGVTQPQANYGQTQPQGQMPPNNLQASPTPSAGAGVPGSAPPSGPMTGQRQSSRGPANLQNSSPDQIRSAQEQLQAAGLYKGPVDGQMDPDTRAAIARFQQQNGMPRTATLDQATLDRLTASRTSGSGSGAPNTAAPMPNSNPGMNSAPAGAGGNTTGQTPSP